MIFQLESSHQVSSTKDGEILHFCGLHQRRQDRKMPKDNVKGSEISLKAKDQETFHGQGYTKQMHIMLSIRGATSQCWSLPKQFMRTHSCRWFCLWSEASPGMRSTHCVCLCPFDLLRLVTYLPSSQEQVYKTSQGQQVHHEARWGGHFPGVLVTPWPWMVQGPILKITNEGNSSRHEKGGIF